MTAVNLKLVETTSRIAELKKTIATPFSIVPDWVPKNQSLQKTLDDLQKQQKELEHYGEKPKQTHVAGIDDLFNGGGDEQKGIAKAYYKWIDDQKNEKLKEGKEALDKEITQALGLNNKGQVVGHTWTPPETPTVSFGLARTASPRSTSPPVWG